MDCGRRDPESGRPYRVVCSPGKDASTTTFGLRDNASWYCAVKVGRDGPAGLSAGKQSNADADASLKERLRRREARSAVGSEDSRLRHFGLPLASLSAGVPTAHPALGGISR